MTPDDAPVDGWRERAKCRTRAAKVWIAEQFKVDPKDAPDVWFPLKGGNATQRVASARAVCNGLDGEPPCAVREACLEYAMRTNERFGVWGGLSEQERAVLRRERRRRAATRRGGRA